MEPLKLVFWNVQHGNATYIRTPNGKNIVIDLGVGSYDSEDEFSPLLHLKNKYGINKLDAVIVSHPHSDHIADIFNFEELSPQILVRPTHLSEDDIYSANRIEDEELVQRYIEICRKYYASVNPSYNYLKPVNNGGVYFEIFSNRDLPTSNINNHSLVTVVNYLNKKIVFPGDLEPAGWRALLGNKQFIIAIKDADILVASHHGRESGFCSDIFEYFTPKLTIISDSYFRDTSATSRYSNATRGWIVHHRSDGLTDERKCVTTRTDGVIYVEVGQNYDNTVYLHVEID